LVTAVEPALGARLAEGVLKQLTGGDVVSARFLYAELFEYQPTYKVWLAANRKPVIAGADSAIWERVKLIPFLVSFQDELADKTLFEKLSEELPGILAWAVEGCLAWQQEGLCEPSTVKLATSEYRTESDVLGQFLTDCCTYEPDASVASLILYRTYSDWCTDNGERAFSGTAFGRALRERGLRKTRLQTGDRRRTTYIGIRLSQSPPTHRQQALS